MLWKKHHEADSDTNMFSCHQINGDLCIASKVHFSNKQGKDVTVGKCLVNKDMGEISVLCTLSQCFTWPELASVKMDTCP